MRNLGAIGAAAVAACMLAASSLAGGAGAATPGPAPHPWVGGLPSLSPIVDRVLPAVVNVSAATHGSESSEIFDAVPDDTGDPALDQLMHRFLDRNGGLPRRAPAREVTALGSGFIIDPAGFIVTNNHLVAGAERVTVVLHDNSRHPARIVGRDERTDIALLKIDAAAPLPFVTWADSDSAKVGDWVVAVGNPYGLGGTVTAGIISARGRNIDEGPYDDFLQIDAPINRGNSGGPTFNLDGEVLGINTAIFSPSGGSIGIGFAIPASFARDIVAQLRAKGHVDHGWLGISVQPVTPSLARSFGINPANPVGALVDDVARDGAAAQAGLRQGDVILAVDGRPVGESHDLPRLVEAHRVGQRIALAVRRDGKDRQIVATIMAMPARPEPVAAVEESAGSSEPPLGPLGMQLTPLTADLRRRLALPRSVDGVVVQDMQPASPAAALGLEPGDVIVSVGHRQVSSPGDAAKALLGSVADGQVLLLINRHGSPQFLGAAFGSRGSVLQDPG